MITDGSEKVTVAEDRASRLASESGSADVSPILGAAERAIAEAPRASAVPINILMVDDRPENLIALEATLHELIRNTGDSLTGVELNLVRASSGNEALRQILNNEFAVILLDVQMPGMDGYEAAALIRQRPQCAHTPIIFLTAINTSETNVFKGYSLGAVDYLFKPYDPVVLRAKVSVFIDLFRKSQEIQRLADEAQGQALLLRASNDELAKTNKIMGGLYRELERKSSELAGLNTDLSKLNNELEKRVADRTRELRDANEGLESEITERRKAEEALKLAKESAEYANSAKDQFLAVLSHELRTPLTPVLAIVQMIDEDPALPEEMRTWVQTIGRNVQLEARLIDDLLDLTRIVSGKLQLNIEPVETHKLVHETVAICREDLKNKSLDLKLELDAPESVVSADPARLQQVLWNLLKNAIKFTPEGGSITLRTSNVETNSESSGTLVFEVIDTGIGIPPERLNSVFNAFEQGDKTITRRFGGLGLGLAISRALMEQHGGSIAAESCGLNQGASFSIKLPLASPNEQSPQKPGSRTSRTASSEFVEFDSKAVQHAAARILLVEDNSDTSEALKVLLERKGFTVLAAYSIEAALETAKATQFDLVISDIGLPDGNGVDLLQKLSLVRPTPAIAMSGFGMDDDIQRSLKAGFAAHLVKPVKFDRLNEVLQSVLLATK